MNDLFTFLGEQTVQALGWTFLHSLWQGGVIALVMALVFRAIPTRLAASRYIAAFSSLLLILIASVTTYFLLLPADTGPAVVQAGDGVVLEANGGVVFWVTAVQEYLSGHLPTIVSLWLIGVIILAIRLAGGFIYIDKMKTESIPLTGKWTAMLNRMVEKTKYSRPVRLAESAMVNIPVAIGMVKPIILFPLAAVNRLSNNEVEAIMAHELAHLIRNDYLHNIIQSIIEVIFYFNPAVWWVSAVIRHERENCCDDIAVNLCGNNLTYAKALISLEDLSGPVPALVLPAKTTEQRLLNRIKRILNQPQTKSNLMEKMIATCILLISITLFSISATTPVEETREMSVEMEYDVTISEYLRNMKHNLAIEILTDTIPETTEKVERVQITRKNDDGEVELLLENDEVKSLMIDGENIPLEDIEKHSDLISELREDLEITPPEPPLPPAPPAAPDEMHPPHAPHPPVAPKPPHPPKPEQEKIDKQIEMELKERDGARTRGYYFKHRGDKNLKKPGFLHDGSGDYKVFWYSPADSDKMKIIVQGIDSDSINLIADSIIIRSDSKVKGFAWNGDKQWQFFPEHNLHVPPNFEFVWPEQPDIDIDTEFFENLEDGYQFYFDGQRHKLDELEEQLRSQGLDKNLRERIIQKQEEVRERFDEIQNRLSHEKLRLYELEQIEEPDNQHQYEFHRDFPAIGIYNFKRKPADRILEEMQEDGWIDKRTENEILLTDKRLKINGEKMPQDVHDKYLRLYEKTTGVPVTGKTKIELKTD